MVSPGAYDGLTRFLMGMVRTFHRATDDQISQLVVAPDKWAAFDAFLEQAEKNNDDSESAYLDKAWDALHFLLTGGHSGGPPLDFIRYGAKRSQAIGDMGYGLAHAFASDEVKRIADALAAITPEDLQRRYDPALMAELEIYPDGMWLETCDVEPETGRMVNLESPAEVDEENLDYLLGHFRSLKSFILKAAADGMGVVTYMH
jgi:hypothetical protein